MYKIGDKVEYLNNVWEVCDWEVDSVEIYNEKMGVNIYVPIDDVTPYRTAHEKLIEMGYEVVKNTSKYLEFKKTLRKDVYTDNYIIIKFNKERREFSGQTYYNENFNSRYSYYELAFYLTLSRILTQYLEEITNETPST